MRGFSWSVRGIREVGQLRRRRGGYSAVGSTVQCVTVFAKEIGRRSQMGDVEYDGNREETRRFSGRVGENDGNRREHGEVDFNHRSAFSKRSRKRYLVEYIIYLSRLHAKKNVYLHVVFVHVPMNVCT